MAGDVVPMDAIIVEIVQNGQTIFVGASLLQFTVVRLWLADATVCGPIVLVAIGGRSELLKFGRPEPTVHVDRLQIGSFASLEVTDATAGPNVFYLCQLNLFMINSSAAICKNEIAAKLAMQL